MVSFFLHKDDRFIGKMMSAGGHFKYSLLLLLLLLNCSLLRRDSKSNSNSSENCWDNIDITPPKAPTPSDILLPDDKY